MSSGIGIDHHKEIAIYAVLTFVAMLSLTLMAPVIKEFIIDRFDASNSFVDRFTVAFFTKKKTSAKRKNINPFPLLDRVFFS